MEANARDLERIFDTTVSYQIPLFQRPYVWDKEANWEPLWEDIQGLLDRHISGGKIRPHFLGAVVFEQLGNASGSIETRQVIDGQQRLTTLQLFLLAARDISNAHGNDKYFERFNDLVTNRENKVDHHFERYKVWPTNSDRRAFEYSHCLGLPEQTSANSIQTQEFELNDSQITKAYNYFYTQLSGWMQGDFDDSESESFVVDLGDRFDALWQLTRGGLKLVVIDLDSDDESQVIFETLNARGTQLLPADLVKNFLLRRAQNEGKNVESLHIKYWSDFDSKFWREEEKQGRFKRPRIDLFLQHYLALMTREDVRVSHLFESFKHYVQDLEDAESDSEKTEPSLTSHPKDTSAHLSALARYAKAYKSIKSASDGSKLHQFLNRLIAIDTATVYPLLLLASDQLQHSDRTEFEKVLDVLESFLMRRMICGLTTKNYNLLFLSAIRAMDKAGGLNAASLGAFLKKGEGDSNRFPNDGEFKHALLTSPLYKTMAQYKLREVLSALDEAFHDKKSEKLQLPKNLTIEHVLPVKWHDNWPIPNDIASDQAKKIEFSMNRDQVLHTLGNLTLITDSLNPSLSNSAWSSKRPELNKFSKLNLNRYFHVPTSKLDKDALQEWNEGTIKQRGELLAGACVSIWAY